MRIYFVLFFSLSFFISNHVLSERIYYSTGSLKLACIESKDSDIEDYAEGICFGYIRANIETLFTESRKWCIIHIPLSISPVALGPVVAVVGVVCGKGKIGTPPVADAALFAGVGCLISVIE